MVFSKIKIFVCLLILFGVNMVSCTTENNENCIIFWEYNPELSLGYLNSTEFSECCTKFPGYIKISFSEIKSFNEDCQVFVLKNELNLNKFGKLYSNSQNGQLFASIILDGEIVINGINGDVLALMSPSTEYPKLDSFKYIIQAANKKNIIISDCLPWDIFTKRDDLDKNLKKLISAKIN